jgi:hypothetical protein
MPSTRRDIEMRRLVFVVFTIAALGFPAADLFAKSRSSASRRSPSASGTGTTSSHTAKSRTKYHVAKGNYNPNTGKRATKTVKK